MTRPRRLGVLGGTFDPIHNGHLGAGDAAAATLSLDEIVVIPSHDPPHRPVNPMASGFHRFAMAALAIDGRRSWRLSDMELTRPGPSYTVHTLRALHARGWAPSQIFFILGADAFAEIATWHEFPAVLHDANFGVVARPGAATLDATWERLNVAALGQAPARAPISTGFFRIEARTPAVSSTDVRARLAAGLPIDDLVPAPVARYIQAHHLYDSSAVDDLHGKAQHREA
jgi:nicotinate-nucleotide adenylyltransferase